MSKQKIVKYTGNGDFFMDVPARDLTMAEWEALAPEIKKAALWLGMYQLPDGAQAPKEGEA